MKRIMALVMTALMLTTAMIAAAENAEEAPDFRTLARLVEIEQKLNAGVTIDSVYYTDGYGFSTSEFRTSDPDEILELWQSLNRITIKKRTDESITDWYPQIVFYFSDGTAGHVTFEAHWLSLPSPWPQANYELENDDAFWNLTAMMVNKYESSVHPKDTYLKNPPEGRYCIGVRNISKDRMDLSLYTEDRYDRHEIEKLMPGDTVIVNGKTYTAAAIVIRGFFDSDGDGENDQACATVISREMYQELLDSHEIVIDCDYEERPDSFELSVFELITAEAFDGYIVFEVLEGNECRAVVDDWNPCTYVGMTTVQMPLPAGFVFEDNAGNEGGTEEFLDDVSEDWYTPYNTTAWFEDGQLIRVSHSDYPMGPEQ